MIRTAYGFKPQTEGRAGRYWQEAPGFAVSAETAGLIHAPRFVMLDKQVENISRRQAVVNVDHGGHVAHAQRRSVVRLFARQPQLPLHRLLVVRGRKTQTVFTTTYVHVVLHCQFLSQRRAQCEVKRGVLPHGPCLLAAWPHIPLKKFYTIREETEGQGCVPIRHWGGRGLGAGSALKGIEIELIEDPGKPYSDVRIALPKTGSSSRTCLRFTDAVTNASQGTRRDALCHYFDIASSLKNPLIAIREEIEKLLELKNDEEHGFKPTDYASEFALTLIRAAYESLDGVFPMPDIMPDGENGIIVEWEREKGGRRCLASLIIRSNPSHRSYLYLRSGAASEVKYNLSGQLIAEQLEWLLS